MEEIKKLREQTGAGIGDCKNALDEAGGDLEKAVEILRKKGISKAAKREGREAKEGLIMVGVNEQKNKGFILQINSETDFVARNEQFQTLSKKIFDFAKEKELNGLDELLSASFEETTVKEEVENFSGVIGEKIEIGNYNFLQGEKVSAYSHLGGKIGVIVSFDKQIADDLALDIAMQVAATNPKYLDPEAVPPLEIEKEKEIYREQLAKEGKPEQIIDKILEGKIAKYFEEVCLSKQEFIKDEDKKIEDALGGVKVAFFIRYSLT